MGTNTLSSSSGLRDELRGFERRSTRGKGSHSGGLERRDRIDDRAGHRYNAQGSRTNNNDV